MANRSTGVSRTKGVYNIGAGVRYSLAIQAEGTYNIGTEVANLEIIKA